MEKKNRKGRNVSTPAGLVQFSSSFGKFPQFLRQELFMGGICFKFSQPGATRYMDIQYVQHRLNMEVDLHSLFGLHVTLCAQLYSLAETLQLPPSPPHLDLYDEGAIGQPR